MAEKDLLAGLRTWLENTGYPLEQLAERAFVRAGFEVRRGVRYPARDASGAEKRREIDVLATFLGRVPTDQWPREIEATVHVVVECKHQKDKPWVAFTSLNHRFPERGQKVVMPVVSGLARAAINALAEHGQVHDLPLFRVHERGCYSLVPAHTTQAQESLFSVIDGVAMGAAAMVPVASDQRSPHRFWMALPVLVTDTNLVECWYEEQPGAPAAPEGIQLEPRSSLRLHWRGAHFTDDYLPIDVVTVDTLDQFAQDLHAGCALLIERLHDHLPALANAAFARRLFNRTDPGSS